MSIQLALDGHSFSVVDGFAGVGGMGGTDGQSVSRVERASDADGKEQASDAAVASDAPCIEVLTPRTMLVPAGLFEAGQAAALLAAGGMAPERGEGVLCAPCGGTVALMSVPEEVVRQAVARAEEISGEACAPEFRDGMPGCASEDCRTKTVRYTTPLLTEPAVNGRSVVWCCRRGPLLFIKVYDNGLRLAEVFTVPGDDDLLYVFGQLGVHFRFGDCVLCLAGERQRETQRMLKKRFKETVCAL